MFENHVLRELYAVLASVAGSITALSFRPFKRMTRVEVLLALFVGTTFAVFVGPYIAIQIYGDEYTTEFRLVGALYYLLATGSNILIPIAIRSLSRFFGKEEEEERKDSL